MFMLTNGTPKKFKEERTERKREREEGRGL